MIAIEGQIPIDVTLESGLLFVALKVRDVSLGYPGSAVGSAIPMVEYDSAAYGASFTGVAGKNYVISTAVYTDATYLTRDLNYPSGSNAMQVIPAAVSAPTVSQIVDGVWDEPIASHLTLGSTGSKLNSVGASGGVGGSADLTVNASEATLEVTASENTLEVTLNEETL